jgi:hypothetical protein
MPDSSRGLDARTAQNYGHATPGQECDAETGICHPQILVLIPEADLERAGAAISNWLSRAIQSLQTWLRPSVRYDPSRSGHIFRDEPGHVNPGSAGSQARFARLFEHVASNPANLRPDAVQAGIIPQDAANAGVQAFTQIAKSGEQIWVTVRNGLIQNAGVNPVGALR